MEPNSNNACWACGRLSTDGVCSGPHRQPPSSLYRIGLAGGQIYIVYGDRGWRRRTPPDYSGLEQLRAIDALRKEPPPE